MRAVEIEPGVWQIDFEGVQPWEREFGALKRRAMAAGFDLCMRTWTWRSPNRSDADRLDGEGPATNRFYALSSATDSQLEVPVPNGLTLKGYQKAGIEFASLKPRCIIADDMGLGKTIQAIGLINLLPSIGKVLIVCPSPLKINWARELKTWLTRPMSVAIVPSGNMFPDGTGADILIVNYERLPPPRGGRGKTIFELVKEKRSPATPRRLGEELSAVGRAAPRLRPEFDKPWDLVVVDESHWIKNREARRSQAVEGALRRAGRVLLLTGTPIENRPADFYNQLRLVAPEWNSRAKEFQRKFCAARMEPWGWDASGHSNLDEFAYEMRSTVMVRRLKRDVLKDLPPRRRVVLELERGAFRAALRREAPAWELHRRWERERQRVWSMDPDTAEYRRAVSRLRDLRGLALGEIARVRRLTAVDKAPAVARHVLCRLEEAGKVVVFAHHREVVEILCRALGPAGCVRIVGGMSDWAKQRSADAFGENPRVRVLVANMAAGGVGLNLCSAQLAVFAELDWKPSTIRQAEDRIHRIGQSLPVVFEHLVIDGSIDAKMAKVCVAKLEISDRALAPCPAD